MTEEIAKHTIGTIVDPFMWFALLVIAGLFFLVWFILKYVVNKSLAELFEGQKSHATHLADYNKTLAVTITLIEGMVYGKGGKWTP